MRFVKQLVLVTVLFVSVLHADNDRIVLNFQNLTIDSFIKIVAKVTGKNILTPENIRGKVNFVSVKPIKKSAVYNLLLNVLKSKGYTIVESEKGYLMVVRSREAIKEAPPFFGKAGEDQIQTLIVGVKNIDASKIYPTIVPLVSKYGRASIVRETNNIVVSDFPKNLILIKQMVSRLDNEKSKKVSFVHLKHADASKIFEKVSKIASTLYPVDAKTKQIEILFDEGTNSVVIVGIKTEVDALVAYAKELDKKDNLVKPKIHIVKLKNADCEMMQKALENIVSKKSYEKNEVKPSITVDKPTNSLIIMSSDKEFLELKKVVDALDIERQQVYVKAKIVEISNKKASQIGAKFGLLGGTSSSSGLYTLSANLGGPAIPFDPKDLGIDIPTIRKGVALGATISLLENNGAAKKLSEPSILCVNNMESTIYVGQTESVIVQGTVGAKTTDYTKNVYTRQDIGLTLKIKPRISSDNKVSLDIKTIVEDILPGSQIGLPITSKREMETTAIVKNGQSIIIGGLVKDNVDTTINKVPLLGDIPVLGSVFRHKDKNNNKTTLAILLTPYIVNKTEELDRLRTVLGKLDELEKSFAQKIAKGVKK